MTYQSTRTRLSCFVNFLQPSAHRSMKYSSLNNLFCNNHHTVYFLRSSEGHESGFYLTIEVLHDFHRLCSERWLPNAYNAKTCNGRYEHNAVVFSSVPGSQNDFSAFNVYCLLFVSLWTFLHSLLLQDHWCSFKWTKFTESCNNDAVSLK